LPRIQNLQRVLANLEQEGGGGIIVLLHELWLNCLASMLLISLFF